MLKKFINKYWGNAVLMHSRPELRYLYHPFGGVKKLWKVCASLFLLDQLLDTEDLHAGPW